MVAAVEAPVSAFSGCRGSRRRRPRRQDGSWSGRPARVEGYRPDRSPGEADTIDAVWGHRAGRRDARPGRGARL